MTLTTHYKKPLNFTFDNLKKAQESYERLRKTTLGLKNDKKTNKKYLSKFEKAINDNLDMPNALQALWGLLRDKKVEGKYLAVEKMDSVLGLELLKINIPEKIKKLAEERESFRKKKEWNNADKLREKIEKAGYVIDDKEGRYIILEK